MQQHQRFIQQNINILLIVIMQIINIINIESMFFSLVDRSHAFKKPQPSKLIMVIPLCARTVIFICDNFNFYHYSLLQEKILYQSKLPGYAIQGIVISGHEILCTIKQIKALILFDIRDRKMEQVAALPLTKLYNQNREKDIIMQTRLINFQKTRSFCIYEPRVQDSIANIFVYSHAEPQDRPQGARIRKISEKRFDIRRKILSRLDYVSKVVLYKQEIEDNGMFKFQTFDCINQFAQKEYQLQNKAFTRFATVNQIINIANNQSQQKLLIFVNCCGPQILLVQHEEVTSYCYKPNKIFLSTVLVNVDFQYGIFKFLPDPEAIDPDYESQFELVELNKGRVQQVKKRTMNEVVKSYQDDYQLEYIRQISDSSVTKFHTYHIIDKKTIYVKMLQQKGFEDLSENLLKEIIQQSG